MRLAPLLRTLASPRFDYLWLGVVLFAVGARLMWRDGAFVAAGDYFPCQFIAPWRCFADAGSLWGASTSAFGAVQFMPGQLALVWIARALDLAGLHGAIAQEVFHGALLAFEGIGAAFFARALWRDRAASIAAGAGVTLSLYTVQMVLLPQEPFAVGLFGLSAGLALHRSRVPVPPWRYGAELGALSAGAVLLMLTPPLAPAWVIWTAAWVGGCALAYGSRTASIGGAAGAVAALALNGWWIYAGVLALAGGLGTTQTSFAGPEALRFVDRNAGIVPLLTMRGAWTWREPDYAPYAAEYDAFPLVLATFAVPALALAGLAMGRRRPALTLGAIAIVSLLIAKGTHAPFGWLNSFAYDRVPFAWLLRDPQYEADPPLYLALFSLAGMGCVRLANAARTIAPRLALDSSVWPAVVYSGSLVALCASGVALVDRSALPATWLRGAFPTSIVIPPYWRDAGDWLNEHGGGRRVLLLPTDDFYEMPYRWGYYGVDEVARAFIDAPIVRLSTSPLNYFSGAVDVERALKRLDWALRAHRPVTAELQALGIGWVIERRDIASSLGWREIEAPGRVAADLRAQPGVTFERSFGLLDVYRVDAPGPGARGYATFGRHSGRPADALVADALRGSDLALASVDPMLYVSPSGAGAESVSRPVSTSTTVPAGAAAAVLPTALVVSARRRGETRVDIALTGPAMNVGARRFVWRRLVGVPAGRGLMLVQAGAETFAFDDADAEAELKLGTVVVDKPYDAIRFKAWFARADVLRASMRSDDGPSMTFEQALALAGAGDMCCGPAALRPVGVLKKRALGVELVHLAGRLAGLQYAVIGRDDISVAAQRGPLAISIPLWRMVFDDDTALALVLHRPKVASPDDGVWLMQRVARESIDTGEMGVAASTRPINVTGPGTVTWVRGPASTRSRVASHGAGLRYDIDLSPATKLLVLDQAYSPGWNAVADGARLGRPHVRVDGVLNGWIVAAPVAHVTLQFAPERSYRMLLAIALVSVILVAMALIAGTVLRRRWTLVGRREPPTS